MTMTRACADEEMDGPPSPLPYNFCLGDQKNYPPPDVSRRLPAEILESVFIHIAHRYYIDEKLYNRYTPTAPSWVSVSYVCRYWRDVALNCPTLWSYIPATSQRWTEELLARSQTAPLKINASAQAQEQKTRVLSESIMEQAVLVINHSQRIQELRIDTGSRETGHQILSNFLSTRLPCLQHLEISYFDGKIPNWKSWLLFREKIPALHTLRLRYCDMPWDAIGPCDLTTLHLFWVGILINTNTMANFLGMLRRMPHLAQLSVEGSLPSARDFLLSGEFNTTPMISLPHLSDISLTVAPLSVATAMLSCVDIPLRTKIHLEVHLESTASYVSTLDDFVRLASLLGQRISQSDSPKFRSLTIHNRSRIALAFSTSERAESYSRNSLFSIGPDDNVLEVIFYAVGTRMDKLDYPVLSGICSQIPLTNIQNFHFRGKTREPEFWRDMLASLSNVRHIRFTPNITSMLSLPSGSHNPTSLQNGRADRGQGEIFVPALEELELYQTDFQVCGRLDPNLVVSELQDLYDAIATRKETRCRLTIKRCGSMPVGGVFENLDSVGWWESAEVFLEDDWGVDFPAEWSSTELTRYDFSR